MTIHLDEGDGLTEAHEINVTPFIDVMLVLLIIFMVAAPLATVDVPVQLPVSGLQSPPRPDKPVFITLQSNGSISLSDEAVQPGALVPQLDAETGGDHGQRIFMRADRNVPYGMLMATMEQLRQAGYLKIGLVAAQDTTP